MQECEPSIEYLELFGVTVAMLLWLKHMPNKKIMLFCDNQSVVHMINNSSSKCRNCMVLLRRITFESMICNSRVYAKYISSKDNAKANALSRMDFRRFRCLDPKMDLFPSEIPAELWPLSKIWLK